MVSLVIFSVLLVYKRRYPLWCLLFLFSVTTNGVTHTHETESDSEGGRAQGLRGTPTVELELLETADKPQTLLSPGSALPLSPQLESQMSRAAVPSQYLALICFPGCSMVPRDVSFLLLVQRPRLQSETGGSTGSRHSRGHQRLSS